MAGLKRASLDRVFHPLAGPRVLVHFRGGLSQRSQPAMMVALRADFVKGNEQ